MGEWFMAGTDPVWWPIAVWAGEAIRPRPAGEFVCRKCGQPLIPCDRCGLPALCGDVYCEFCQPSE
jgi:hypothetical protein